MSTTRNLTALSVFVSTILVGCIASPPTESEARLAVEQKMSSDYEKLTTVISVADLPTKPKLSELKILKCHNSSGNSYKCDVELEVVYKDIPAKGTSTMQFSKSDLGWVVTN